MKHSHIHAFNPSKDHLEYEECDLCGTLHRIKNVAPPGIYESGYWDRQGFSNLREQIFNVSQFQSEDGRTKIDAVMKHAGEGSHALELACAPGSLLMALREKYDHVVGVEVDTRYRVPMLDIVQGAAALVFGMFPEISKCWPSESFDLITALDLFEHIEDGEAFMAEVLRLLKPDGRVILMSPFQTEEPLDAGQFCPEHIFLYSESFIKEWFGEMFKSVATDKWVHNHNIVVGVGKKKKGK